jgi:hypothetical protein
MSGPTLLGLPLQLRIHIYDYVFANAKIVFDFTNDDDDSQIPAWKSCSWGVSRPLLRVSRKYILRLRNIVTSSAISCGTCFVVWSLAENGEHRVVDFFDYDLNRISSDLTTAAPATICHDFWNLLTTSVRSRIRRLTLWSVYGPDGHYYNKDQFPNLKIVHLETLLCESNTKQMNGPGKHYDPEMWKLQRYDLEMDEHPYDIKGGERDELFVRTAK